jgi:hypothetical protein
MEQSFHTEDDGTKVYSFKVTYEENNSVGWFVRAFHPEKKHFEMRDSYFDGHLPRWIKHDGVELVEGKGMPTVAYFDMHCMRALGVKSGELRTLKICSVHDLDSALHLEWLQRNFEQQPLSELVANTRIYRSRETSIIQSGHKITSVKVDGGKRTKLDDVFKEYQYDSSWMLDGQKITDSFNELLDKYAISPNDEILWRYDINLKLEPYS